MAETGFSLVYGGGNWEVRVKMNLNHTLSVGRRMNSSPVTKMAPVIRLQHGCNHTIVVPVEDADGDDVRCRWAESEPWRMCGSLQCFPSQFGQPRMHVRRTALMGTLGYYAVSLQIEDFYTTLDTVAMSSVPLQFLVLVYQSEETCYNKPDFDDFTEEDGACIGNSTQQYIHRHTDRCTWRSWHTDFRHNHTVSDRSHQNRLSVHCWI